MAAVHSGDVNAQTMIDQLQGSLRETQLDLVETAEAVEVGMARTQTLRELLDEQMRVNAAIELDLDLYRQIETSEKSRAVEVESLSWDSQNPSILQLTLIQWQGRDRISGELAVSLNYTGGFLDGSSDGEENDNLSDELTLDLDSVNFEFRFFQTLTIPIPSDLTQSGSGKSQFQLPHSLNVRIIPADGKLKAIETQFSWNDVAQ